MVRTAMGFTEKAEAWAMPRVRYVAWYKQNLMATVYYVAFTNRKAFEAFLRGHGSEDGIGSPRSCGAATR